jgi:Fic family protein
MSLDDIVTMHRMVAEEAGIRYDSAGKMREEGFQVYTGTQGIGYHMGAPPERLPQLMRGYIQFVNGPDLNSLSPIIHALIAHFFITTIHPFSDGNGRVSRLVSAAVLFQRGYNGHGFYALSSYFYENEERYHRVLLAAQQEPVPDLTDFVAFGMEGLALELRGISNFIKIKLNRVGTRDKLPVLIRRRSRRLGASH